MQLLHTFSGVKKNKFSKFVLYALQFYGSKRQCTIEKGITLIQVRENKTACKGRRLCRRRGADGYAELPR